MTFLSVVGVGLTFIGITFRVFPKRRLNMLHLILRLVLGWLSDADGNVMMCCYRQVKAGFLKTFLKNLNCEKKNSWIFQAKTQRTGGDSSQVNFKTLLV